MGSVAAMVNPTLQSAIEATEEQRSMVRSRAAELDADPSIGLRWDELQARLRARWA
jgi:putative addiction module component (TIGR02574 family)